ncbi:MAG: tetratricopeptide repeat protein [Candidatus Daviesbacteria bacterium]|nr:tetratricopeptide repeat protein [Candidatus Daviesbacteria bacterium]
MDQKAIDAALNAEWELALKLNRQIVKLDPQNIDALNRLAKAHLELGKTNLAKKYYSEVTKIDPYNPIALKNLKIIKSSKHCKGATFTACAKTRLSPSLFLQEPGKTKMVSLLKVAEPQKLSQAFCGMQVEMAIKNRKITVVDANGSYLGVLPDDISHHILRLFKGGNKYELFVKAVRVNSLSVIIKETFRSKKFKNQPSFLEYAEGSSPSNIITSFEGNGDGDSEEPEEEQEV